MLLYKYVTWSNMAHFVRDGFINLASIKVCFCRTLLGAGEDWSVFSCGAIICIAYNYVTLRLFKMETH